MDVTTRRAEAPVPRKPRHHSYDESADEPAKLIEQETVEVEGEIPAEPNEPVEGGESEEHLDGNVLDQLNGAQISLEQA